MTDLIRRFAIPVLLFFAGVLIGLLIKTLVYVR